MTVDYSKVQAIFTDLDGTLLNKNSEISSQTREALEKAVQKGFPVIPVTGRHSAFVLDLFANFPPAPLAGASNGAVLLHLEQGNVLQAHRFSKEKAKKILSTLETTFAGVCLGHEHLDSIVFSQELENYLGWGSCQDPLQQCLKIFAMNPHMQSGEFYQAVKAMFEPEASVVYSRSAYGNKHWVEILPGQTNKGTIARQIAQQMNLDLRLCIGIGDELNDLPLFEQVGIALAVDNAEHSIKEKVDVVVESNEEFAVAKTINRVLNAKS